ncbi:MAG: hypothetical protein ACT4N8_05855, partial [Sphingosinicella sp.]|uniref:hypothetical protein n=1 Tax=Sphingosinicella sp. TaxID=1917971 RepID=UPI004037E563
MAYRSHAPIERAQAEERLLGWLLRGRRRSCGERRGGQEGERKGPFDQRLLMSSWVELWPVS